VKGLGLLYALFKYLLFRPICLVAFRPWVEGEENIPAEGGVIIAGNHLSAGDTFLLPAMIRRRMTFPAKAELFHGRSVTGRILAWFLKGVGQVPMDRSGGRASADGLRPVYEVLENGGVVGICPEGTRSHDGRLYRGRTGVARLALGAGVPVVPVGFFNTEFRRGPFGIPVMKRPGIRIGRPLDFSESFGATDGSVYRQVTDSVIEAIQDLTGQEYVPVYSNSGRAQMHSDRTTGTR
jgi:1-acyl-sn-glycerol-3-phosphate acyltransferase